MITIPKRAPQTIPLRISQLLGQNEANLPFLQLLGPDGTTESYTYREVIRHSLAWARIFKDRGLKPADHIVVILQHSLDLYTAYLGAVFAGIVPAMFAFPSPKFSRQAFFHSIHSLIQNAGAKLIVTYAELKRDFLEEASKHSISAIQIITPQEQDMKAPIGAEALSLAQLNPSPAEIAFLQYSSGTTGLKKGVSISHRALLWQIDAYARSIDLSPQDRIVTWLPLYHDMGLITCYWMPLLTATPVIAMATHDWARKPAMLLDAISKHSGSLCWLPNFAFNHMVKSIDKAALNDVDLSSLRGVINCSEPVLPQSHDLFYNRFAKLGMRKEAFWASYALAENTFAVTSGGAKSPLFIDRIDALKFKNDQVAVPSSKENSQHRAFLSSGEVLPETEVRIVSPEGHERPERAVGEIVLRTPCLADGYHNNSEATLSAFKQGWYYTGDLGYRVGSQLIVTGRKKDMVIINGHNIYPHDLEYIINTTPGVIPGRSVALGLPDPDSGTDKLIVIAECSGGDSESRSKLRQEIFRLLTSCADVTPSDIRIVDHGWLMKSSSGKVARNANREKYCELLNSESAPAKKPAHGTQEENSEMPLAARIRNVVHKLIPQSIPQILSDESTLITSGLIDSLALVHLIVGLEEEFKIIIPDTVQWNLQNFDSIHRLELLIETLIDAQTQEDKGLRLGDGDSERDWKCKWYLQSARNFDALIIGSSRVMGLSAERLDRYGCKGYNFSVNNARVEDWYCILQFVLEHTHMPLRYVLLGVDIEAFTNGAESDYRLVKCQALVKYLYKSNGLEIIADPHKDLTGGNRLAEVRNNLRTQGSNLTPYTFDVRNGELIYVEDEQLISAFKTRQPLLGRDVNLDAQKASYKIRLDGFTALSPVRLHYFVQFLKECLARNIHVIGFISPLHKELESFVDSETSYGHMLEEFKVWLLKNNLHRFFTFFDCSTPEKFNGLDQDFIDAAHVGPYNADALLDFAARCIKH